MSGYPMLVDGPSVRALVVGGGAVAARKAVALLESGAAVRVVATTLGAELKGECDGGAWGGRLSITERPYRTGDVADATLVIAATDSREVNARVTADAREKCRLVNVADAPAEGDWVTVATHRAGPLIVSVSAGGVPSAAARIRDAIAERFDGRYGEALTALGALRARLLRAGWRDAEAALVGPDFCERVERGELTARAAAWR